MAEHLDNEFTNELENPANGRGGGPENSTGDSLGHRHVLDTLRSTIAERGSMPAPGELADIIRTETSGVLTDVEMLNMLRTIRQELTGAGVLDPLLRQPGVTDVLVTAPDEVWIDRGNGMEATEVRFPSESDVRALATRLLARCGRRLDDAQPFADGHIPDGVGGAGVRVHAVLSPPATEGTLLSLRVLHRARKGLPQLGKAGLFPPMIGQLLRKIVDSQLSYVVAGGTGSGKTTLLAAMLSEVAEDQRIICIEDTPELAPHHPHVVKLVTRPPNVEGIGAIDQQNLLRQALRMRPDRIIVGEIRGAEVVDLLAALNTGHSGGGGTIHANSVHDVLARFEAVGLIGGLDRAALHAQLSAAVQVVLLVRRAHHRRVLSEIGLILGNPPTVQQAWSADDGCGPAWEQLLSLCGLDAAWAESMQQDLCDDSPGVAEGPGR